MSKTKDENVQAYFYVQKYMPCMYSKLRRVWNSIQLPEFLCLQKYSVFNAFVKELDNLPKVRQYLLYTLNNANKEFVMSVYTTKQEVLKAQGSLNPHPEKISDPLFQENDFFDPEDLAQVKYEMIRRVQNEGCSVKEAAKAFGFSRGSFYLAKEAFERDGLVGLLCQKRGPRGAHKLEDNVMAVVLKALEDDPSFTSKELAALVEKRFGFSIHSRSVERALERHQKKRRKCP